MRERTVRRRRERHLRQLSEESKRSARVWPLAILLVIGTLALYSPVANHGFINYDDDGYVSNNPNVTAGLSWQTIRWSMTATEQANWHPVTWLSHQLDCELFGLDAGYHHLTSVLIHAINVVLVFLLLQKATGAAGPSLVVAALFAWHPFNVESVAWVAERKNVLSTFFALLSIGAYGWYARKPALHRLLLVTLLFALALMSKPMAVTLPFLLLLLDYWPLQRVIGWSGPGPQFVVPQKSIVSLIVEKWPFFLLSLASCVITIWAQKGAVKSLHLYPIAVRLENALYSYVIYLGKTFWPSRFALFYPHPGASLALWKPVLALVLLSAISAALWMQRSVRPYLLVAWLWFLGTLVPVIGVVQVGDQALANRYAYLPLIGLFVLIVWGSRDLFNAGHLSPRLRWGIAIATLATIALLSRREISYWRDSVSAWSHTLEVTTANLPAEQSIASALDARGENDAAIPHYLNVIRLDPTNLPSRINVGVYYVSHGRMQDGVNEFQTVVDLSDHKQLDASDLQCRASAQLNLGFAYILAANYPKALASFRETNQAAPTLVAQSVAKLEQGLARQPAERGYLQLSLLMRARGENEEAATVLENASRENPEYVKTRELLSYLKSNP